MICCFIRFEAAFRINDTLNEDTGYFSLYNLTDQQLKEESLKVYWPSLNIKKNKNKFIFSDKVQLVVTNSLSEFIPVKTAEHSEA